MAPIHQGHKFREKSAKALVDEIERGYREFGLKFFYLWGDTVTLNVKTFSAFCDELIARKLPMHWFGNARADNLTDPAFVNRLRRSGCWMLAHGHRVRIDGDPQGHAEAPRGAEDSRGLREHARRPASSRSGSSSLAIRATRRQSSTRTIDYAIELDPDFANFYPAVPVSGH